MIWTAAQLCEIFGVDRRTVTNWQNEAPPIPSTKLPRARSYDAALVLRWALERAARFGREAAEKERPETLDGFRTRKVAADARLAEIEVAKAEGESIPTAVHERRLMERLDTVAGAVKAISRYHGDVKAAMTDEEADALLERMSDEMMAELYELSEEIE